MTRDSDHQSASEAGDEVTPTSDALRHAPQQARSRRRVEQILLAAEALVAQGGLEALNTRSVADAARTSPATLYQYFADRDAIIVALAERGIQQRDRQAFDDVVELLHGAEGGPERGRADLAEMISVSLRSCLRFYVDNPAFVRLYLHDRSSPALIAFVRERNRALAVGMREMAINAGVLPGSAPDMAADMIIGIGDYIFQYVFETGTEPNLDAFEEGVRIIHAYMHLGS
ncbi:TetR/AcrR family transcriptional regulator [Nocardioides sp. Leaf285]|uniref:TetR/AcrR family transcriptional regulator n=1 Tax=Nocardioides sp. Leaf285 TaxID=1736322 RepID=UPI0007032C0E|nr:TetR/AcrR family transcriptional regulator [Nocardioides sp. Leaf285]KQP63032.1 hypothetical protein ASF47_18650 [Nocardioides sp. Leaf285]